MDIKYFESNENIALLQKFLVYFYHESELFIRKTVFFLIFFYLIFIHIYRHYHNYQSEP